MKRRTFLRTSGTGLAAAAVTGYANTNAKAPSPTMTADQLDYAHYKGFNLLEKFSGRTNNPFRESDFAWMAEWGFNFARLPMSYWTWGKIDDWDFFDESVLREIDQAIEWGRQYNIHIDLNMHRAPGYCVNQGELEPYQLFEDPVAVEATRKHWMMFAERYKGIPNERLTFDLLNEPKDIPEPVHNPVMKQVIEGIRSIDPDRLIVLDGLNFGRRPILGIQIPNMAQSTRGYDPFRLTHYKAGWVPSEGWPLPTWPYKDPDGTVWDQETMWRERIEPWFILEERKVPVHVGEWGVYCHTPHEATLGFMRASLDNWRKARWGWALWNLRGTFGILDSERSDVKYESFRGHRLDRKMLEVLLADLEAG